MTPELIRKFAREAGFLYYNSGNFSEQGAIDAFAALVAAHQRELDARLCESEDLLWVDGKPTADAFAAAIRGTK